MKLVYLVAAACALSVAGVRGTTWNENEGHAQSEAKAMTVTMKSMSYDPKTLEVHVGDSVVWRNEAHSKHTAISDDDGKTFNTGEIEPGQSSRPVRFDKEGEFKYHCEIHGKSMSGTIVVAAAAK